MTAARPLRLAHRGDWRAAPENSRAALVAALEVPGLDGVELDVRRSSDGVPVLVHDETLARVHRRPERVDALTVGELAAVGVATLEEVLAAVPASAFVDIELKGGPGLDEVVGIVEAARGPGIPPATAITSFDVDTLRVVARLRPEWPRWLNAEDLSPATIGAAVDLGCEIISSEWRAIDEEAMERARAAGVAVATWTIRDAQLLARVEGLGVVAVCVEGEVLGALER